MGNEKSINEYIKILLCLFRECVRVLTEDGNIVFNIGDKYQNSNLLLVPYRFALAAMDTQASNNIPKEQIFQKYMSIGSKIRSPSNQRRSMTLIWESEP